MTTLAFVHTQERFLPDAPSIPGLTFRTFQGDDDLPGMLDVVTAARIADREDVATTLADYTNMYHHLTNCDPYQDILIAEINGQMAAYSRVTWYIEEATGGRVSQAFILFVAPEWRSKGLTRAMLHYNENRLLEIAANQPQGTSHYLEGYATSFQPHYQELLESEGYKVVRRGFMMRRPDLENIPDLPMPEGLEVRPVRPDQYRQIWDASQEAFRDHWGYVEPTEENYQEWLGIKEFQPDLWQVAWDVSSASGTEEVAGMILNFINHDENEKYNRKRGWTECICVRRPWRRRGLARALLARSLKMHRDLGMTETALGVDAENLTGARQLYESMGYQAFRVNTTYRKLVE